MQKRILIVSDAWKPQVNGVVTTLTNVSEKLREMGHDVRVVSPEDCSLRFRVPFYPEIRLGLPKKRVMENLLHDFQPNHIHISTPEGPLGRCWRKLCKKYALRYTTAYHTKFPEFVKSITKVIPVSLGHLFMKHVNKHSRCIMVPTQSMIDELGEKGYKNVKLWGRGYDKKIFRTSKRVPPQNNPPRFVCVSRVSAEKNLEKFFELDVRGDKIMVGDGPERKKYEKRYPDVTFVGFKTGSELASYYQNADVFVFPSKKDTFGVVMIESLACGTPIAAYDVTGPKDVVIEGVNGFVGDDLEENAMKCLDLDREVVYNSSSKYSWTGSAKEFLNNLVRIGII